jgi:hypothetical protein
MKLRYNNFSFGYKYYDIKCPNIAFYKYRKFGLPIGVYKGKILGLYFWESSGKEIKNYPAGIKADL